MSANMSAESKGQRPTRLLLTAGAVSSLIFLIPATLMLLHSLNFRRDGDPEGASMAAAVVSLFYPGVLSLLKMFELIVEDAPAMFRDGVVLIFGSMLYFALGTLWAWCAVSIRGKREGRQHIAVTAIHGITLVVLSLLLLQELLATGLVFLLGAAVTLNTHSVIIGSVLGLSILAGALSFR